MNGRIRFKDNPWKDGHIIEEFSLRALLHEDGVGLMMHLRTADYDDDYAPYRQIKGDDYDDWRDPDAWRQLDCAIISSVHWGYDPRCLPPMVSHDDKLDASLTGFHTFAFNHSEENDDLFFDEDDQMFSATILGADRVLDHQILLEKDPMTGLFRVEWSGGVSLGYAGETEATHSFIAHIDDVAFEGFQIDSPEDWHSSWGRRQLHTQNTQHPSLEMREARARRLAKTWLKNAKSLEFVRGETPSSDYLVGNLADDIPF